MHPAEFKAARHTLGLSAAKLARALGVHGRTVQRWEHGPGDVPGPAAIAIGSMMGDHRLREDRPGFVPEPTKGEADHGKAKGRKPRQRR